MSLSISASSRRISIKSKHDAYFTVRRAFSSTPSRNATLMRRPKRPYTFTQLVTLTDGSTFMHRTTSPLPVYKATKDVRNSAMWNPSSQKLMNVEEDEAGKLRAFRERFGRGWDAEGTIDASEATTGSTEDSKPRKEPDDYLIDLISSYSGQEQSAKQTAKDTTAAKDKKK